MLQNGITLKTITKDNLPEYVYMHTDTDLVFSYETERVFKKNNSYSDSYISMMEYDSNVDQQSPYNYTENKFNFTDIKSEEFNMLFSYVMQDELYGIHFVSKNRDYPNSELIKHKKIYRYGWINNEQFIYSVKNQGIYMYNPKKRTIRTLAEGDGEFYIKGIENNKLIYDDKKLDLV